MSVKITINLQQMNRKKHSYLWNRLTPTLGGRSVIRMLSSLCSERNIAVSIASGRLYIQAEGGTQKYLVPDSESYARTLKNAGVSEIKLPQGSNRKLIKYVLDTLSDYPIGRSSDRLVQIGFHMQLEGDMNRLT